MSAPVDVPTARTLPGLRLVTLAGVPSPWSEAAKGIFHVKRVRYTWVAQVPGMPTKDLEEWTGQSSAPAAMYEEERPRTGWAEILHLAERLGPEPRLIPEDPEDRALLFGIAHELMGELGLCWNLRLLMVLDALSDAPRGPFPREAAAPFGAKYGYSPEAASRAEPLALDQIAMVTRRLRAQAAAGSPYLIGERLTAADIYSAASTALLGPLPEDQCPMPDFFRQLYTSAPPALLERVDPILYEHRSRIYERHLELPVRL